MNQRNVEALVKVLLGFAYQPGSGEMPLNLALQLADHGVLVPSALTDEEVDEIYMVLEGLRGHYRRETQIPAARQLLERIAKGETPEPPEVSKAMIG